MNKEYERNEKMIRECWFPNHEAAFEGHDGVYFELTWANPANRLYFCRYIIDSRVLMVYGDIGEAVYAWSQPITWAWLAGLELDYFSGKCCASETGRQFKQWSAHEAEARIKEALSDPDLRKEYLEDAILYCGTADEWGGWLHKNGMDAFGGQWIEMGEIGQMIHIRYQGHLLGIKMALEKSNE